MVYPCYFRGAYFLSLIMSRLFLPIFFSFFFSKGLFGQSVFHPEIVKMAEEKESIFPFGLASGDPTPNSILLWTKVLLENQSESVEVKWQIATDTLLKNVVANGTQTAKLESAFTVQINVDGLQPSTTYFYRFHTASDTSAIGRTKTASQDGEAIRFAVASCSNYQYGYFTAYAHMAKQNDLDAVLFLGDYIYEYGPRADGDRTHIPAREIVSLEDYRSRYAQYRLDSNLQEVHRLHPFITIWDDHEIANNSYAGGAGNHQDEEGDWEVRKANALQAFYEWIPVRRKSAESGLFRSLSYGNMAELFMIDGRVEGRSEPVADFNDPLRYDTARTMLGAAQRNWLLQCISNSKAKWRVLVNDVMFAPMDLGKFAGGRRFNMDAWDGYEGDRNRIFNVLENDTLRNLIVVTGDIHTAWAIELTRDPSNRNSYDRKTGKGVWGAEFVVPSISSPNLDEAFNGAVADLSVPYIKGLKRNKHLRYLNSKDHGYFILELTEAEAKATWIYVKNLKKPELKIKRKQAFAFPYNGKQLKRVKP